MGAEKVHQLDGLLINLKREAFNFPDRFSRMLEWERLIELDVHLAHKKVQDTVWVSVMAFPD